MKSNGAKIAVVIVIMILISIIFQIKAGNNEEEKFLNEDLDMKQLPRLIDFGSDCATCAQMIPILNEIKEEYKGRLIVEVVDVYDNPSRTSEYNIMTIPTQVFLNEKGEEVFRNIGPYSVEEIKMKLTELGIIND